MYRAHDSMKVGDIHQYVITYIPEGEAELGSSIFVKVKNVETIFMRPNLLSGPYVLYCDITPAEFDNRQRTFITADQPRYNPKVSSGQSIIAELSMHTLKDRYVWIVNVSSQIIFNTSSTINFEIIVCREQKQLHKRYYGDGHFGSFCDHMDVQHMSTIDIWNRPPLLLPSDKHPVHLVILTHGMYSNTTADMWYMATRITEMCEKTGENVVMRAFTGNVCHTERGVKYLGRRIGEWLVNECVPSLERVDKISFIAHSLGGPSQTFAVAYIEHNYPEFFEKIQPENFVTMASPLLGISNENPAYVKFFLTAGIVGKTGQDLGLQGNPPLMLLLPSASTRRVLGKFKRRSVYANVLHDGIVPLRTAALMYLDWNALAEVYDALKDSGTLNPDYSSNTSSVQAASSNDVVGEVPDNVEVGQNDQDADPRAAITSSAPSNAESLELETQNDDSAVDLPGQGEEGNDDDDNDGNGNDNDEEVSKSHKSGKKKFSLKEKINKHRLKKYERYQTSPVDPIESASITSHPDKPIPKTNVITSMMKVLAPPAVPEEYILDPSTRKNVILHDRIYHPSMIPRPKSETSDSALSSMDAKKRNRILEERIARKWHKGLTWRKVLVNLLPDAHNNMIVRRTFANAYGWPVVDHMVEHHFGPESFAGQDLEEFELTAEDKKASEYIELDEHAEDDEMARIEERMAKLMHEEHHKSVSEGTTKGSSSKRSSLSHGLHASFSSNPTGGTTSSTGTTGTKKAVSEAAASVPPPKPVKVHLSKEEDGSWVNDNDSIIYDGPTGMLNTIPETANKQMDAIRNAVFPDEAESEEGLDPDAREQEQEQQEIYASQASEVMNSYL